MSTYNATLWPNLQTPSPTNIGKVGGTIAQPTQKNLAVPAAVNDGKNGGLAAAPTPPSMAAPVAASTLLQTWSPSAPPTIVTTYKSPYQTALEQRQLFMQVQPQDTAPPTTVDINGITFIKEPIDHS